MLCLVLRYSRPRARKCTVVRALSPTPIHCPCARMRARPAAHTARTRALAGALARPPARPHPSGCSHPHDTPAGDIRPPPVSESDRVGTGPTPDSLPALPGASTGARTVARRRRRPRSGTRRSAASARPAVRRIRDFFPRGPAPPKSPPPRPAHCAPSRSRACSH